MFKNLGSQLKEAATWLTRDAVLSTAMAAMTGKGVELPANAGDLVKGIHGNLGWADEREMSILMTQLDPDDAALIDGFMRWCTEEATSPMQKFLAWNFGNGLRSFITGMTKLEKGSSRPLAEEVTVKKALLKRGERTTTTKRNVPDPSQPPNLSLEFLKDMVRIIKSKPTVLEGYEALLASLKGRNIPTMPWALADAIENFLGTFEMAVANKAKEISTRPRRKKSWLEKLLTFWNPLTRG